VNALDILRRVTKPKTDSQAVEAVVKRYGATLRENFSSDDSAAVQRAAFLVAKRRLTVSGGDRNGDQQAPVVA